MVHAEESSRQIIELMKSIRESGRDYLDHSREVRDFIHATGKNILEQENSTESITAENQEIASELNEEMSKSRQRLVAVQNTEKASDEARKSIQNSVNQMIGIQKSSKQILDILHVINDIAERTNLLAMNAAIEAAHAGDTGRGFAVVAGEIRGLAEMTGENSRNIDASIKSIVQEINSSEIQARKTAEKMEESFQELHALTGGLNETIEVISSLGNKSNFMYEHLQELSRNSKSISKSAETSDSRIESISGGLLKLVEQLQNAEHKVEKVYNSIEEQSAVFAETADSIESNTRDIQSLYDMVKGFS